MLPNLLLKKKFLPSSLHLIHQWEVAKVLPRFMEIPTILILITAFQAMDIQEILTQTTITQAIHIQTTPTRTTPIHTTYTDRSEEKNIKLKKI